MANQIFTKLIDILCFGSVVEGVGYPRPSSRTEVTAVDQTVCQTGSFKTRKYPEALRDKFLMETESFLNAWLQADRCERN